jgi:hypothetical protein
MRLDLQLKACYYDSRVLSQQKHRTVIPAKAGIQSKTQPHLVNLWMSPSACPELVEGSKGFASGGMTVLPESLGVATEYLVVACLTGSVKTSFSALRSAVSFVCREPVERSNRSLRPE